MVNLVVESENTGYNNRKEESENIIQQILKACDLK